MPLIKNRCGYAHPKNAVCRECDYLAEKERREGADSSGGSLPPSVRKDMSVPSAVARGDDSGDAGTPELHTQASESRVEALSAAQRQARYRANNLERVQKREKLRKKLQRAKK